MKSNKTNSTARALVYAVTFINLRNAEDNESDADVGALESIAAIIANCNESELDQLSHAAKEAFTKKENPPILVKSFLMTMAPGWNQFAVKTGMAMIVGLIDMSF